MLQRVLEPEVMNTVDEAVDYDQMDHSDVNRRFIDDFLALASDGTAAPDRIWQVFDAGTGTALIPIELIRSGFRSVVTASDLADEMLNVARRNVAANKMEASIKLVLRDCKNLPDSDETYDAIISNSIVHHIPEPRQVITELWRILRPGGVFFVRDLCRPENLESLEKIVQTYAGDANPHQRQMFRDSLHAALTIDEVRALVEKLGVSADFVQATSDRHWTIQCRKEEDV